MVILVRLPLAIEAITNSIKYYHRLPNFSLSENNILYSAFIESKSITARSGWFKNIKTVMAKCRISLDTVFHERLFSVVKKIKYHFQSTFINGWKEQLSNDSRNKDHGNKLRTYRSFKTNFAKEHYLNTGLQRTQLSSFAKLRMGAHHLQIERDRYSVNRIPPEQRSCKICECGDCEDEFHFVMVCSKYQTLRNDLFSKISERCQELTE